MRRFRSAEEQHADKRKEDEGFALALSDFAALLAIIFLVGGTVAASSVIAQLVILSRMQ